MVKVNYLVLIFGMLCLTIIYVALLVTDHVDGTIGATIVGVIALCMGVLIPSPKIDNKRGVFIW